MHCALRVTYDTLWHTLYACLTFISSFRKSLMCVVMMVPPLTAICVDSGGGLAMRIKNGIMRE